MFSLKNNHLVDLLCQIDISLLYMQKLLKYIPGFFKSFQSQGFSRIFKVKLSNSKLFYDSCFLATLICSHLYVHN